MNQFFRTKHLLLFSAAILFGLLFYVFYSLFFPRSLPFFAALVGNTSQATLSVSPSTGSYNPNDTFVVSIYVNTNNQNVVGVSAYFTYDKTHFEATSIDTTGSVFTIEWEKIIDSANGKIKISRTIPTPGVNTANGLVAKVNFKALSGVSPASDNLTFDFTPGVNMNSQVILDDHLGTNILSGVYNGKYTVTGGTDDTQPPSVPTNLSATAVSSSQINLSWTASTDNVAVTGYRIYRGGVEIGTSATNSYSNTGLSASTAYSYTVAAYDAVGNLSSQSSSASATTQVSSDVQAPTVTAFTIPSTSSSLTVSISTFTATDNVAVTGYLITESATAPSASASGWSATYPTSYTFSSSGSKILYAWAKDAAGNVSASRSATVTITISQTLNVILSASPSSGSAPLSGVDLVATVGGSITGNMNYTFYCNRSDTGTNITTPYDAKFDNQTQTSYTASNLCNYSSAGSYTAKVIIERSSYQAEARATITASSPVPADTTPPSISSVSASSITASSATINWATNEISDSQVEYGPTTSYGSQTGLNTSLATSHSVLLSNLSPSTKYHYRVKSSDAAGNPATSGDYTFTTTAVSLTLSVTLSVSPSSGTAPLSGVDLTASVSGTATGNANYTFYCNRSDTGVNVTSPYDVKYNSETGTTKTATNLCSYSTAGSYTAKVIVERGSYQAEARAAVVVNQPAGAGAGTGATTDYTPFGYIDSADQDKVAGWAYDQNLGASPLSVKIFVDEKDVATVTANQERKDIVGAANGIVKDAFHGFSYNFSGLSSGTHTIRAFAMNMPGENIVELASSPKNITVPGFFDFLRSVLKVILRSHVLFFICLFVVIFIILKMIV